jgi:hypothetical protein
MKMVTGELLQKKKSAVEWCHPGSLADGLGQKWALIRADDEMLQILGLDDAGEWRSWPVTMKQGGGQWREEQSLRRACPWRKRSARGLLCGTHTW